MTETTGTPDPELLAAAQAAVEAEPLDDGRAARGALAAAGEWLRDRLREEADRWQGKHAAVQPTTESVSALRFRDAADLVARLCGAEGGGEQR